MGTTISRPILSSIEAVFLKTAQIVDTVIQFAEQLLSSLFTLCLPASIHHDLGLGYEKDARACDEQGVCYIPATRVKQREHWRQRHEERLRRRKLRAEWAAAGLDVNEMERQERARRKKALHKPESIDVASDKASLEAMLGLVAKSPPARPESERETSHEREKGKLWIMGNIASAAKRPIVPTGAGDDQLAGIVIAKNPRRAVLESVREASHHESREYPVQGHGGRIASGASEHGDISYQIVASSKEPVEEHVAPLKLAERKRRVITPQGVLPSVAHTMSAAITASRLEVTSSSKPSHKPKSVSLPLLETSLPSKPSSPNNKKAPTIPQPTVVKPTAQRLRKALDLRPEMAPLSLQSEKPLLEKKDPIDIRGDSPRFFNRARASLDQTAAVPYSYPLALLPSNSKTPPPPFSSASSDAGSIASRRSLFGANISRSSTPPCVIDLADSACKSRWEANARERKVWKGEVDRITLHRLHQTSKRHRESNDGFPRTLHGEVRLISSASATDAARLAAAVDKRLRRASFEPRLATKAVKVKRRSSQKA